ncbi:MAG: ABC transporter substrate-binding protein [Proteobacteria bacterium]|nr:ABC transporter substrate-binding protein [Pseudomonadota bacterium]
MVLGALVACGACRAPDRGPHERAGRATPRDGGTLRVASTNAVVTLDPTYALEDASMFAIHAMTATLVDYEPATADPAVGARVVPGLAERWDVSPDGLAYTFALRAHLAYADGSPIVAADVRAALERARATPDSPFGVYLANVAQVTAPDARTLTIRLTTRDVAFLDVLAMPFTAPRSARDPELASGPFVLASWDRGQRLVLARNPHYWNAARVHLARIVLVENVPRDVQFLMFEAGELDAAERLSAADHAWLADQPAWQPYVHRRALMNAYGSRMNVRQKPFDDRRVRQALNYALDKSHTVKLLAGTGVASHGVLPPGLFGRDDTLAPYPHDPARARALLAEAGYPDGFDVDYAVMNDDEAVRLATSLQADLAEVGVRVHLSVTAFSTYATILGRADGTPLAKASWLGDFPDPSSFFDALFHSRGIADDNATNWSFYENRELDALLDAARREPDEAQRAAMYRRAERIVYDDAPWIWDYHQQLVEVVQPYVRDYEPHPVWQRDYTSAWLDRVDDRVDDQ